MKTCDMNRTAFKLFVPRYGGGYGSYLACSYVTNTCFHPLACGNTPTWWLGNKVPGDGRGSFVTEFICRPSLPKSVRGGRFIRPGKFPIVELQFYSVSLHRPLPCSYTKRYHKSSSIKSLTNSAMPIGTLTTTNAPTIVSTRATRFIRAPSSPRTGPIARGRTYSKRSRLEGMKTVYSLFLHHPSCHTLRS